MTAAQPGAALASDRINFINKNNTGRIFLRLREKVAYAGRTDADKHFHEIGAADTEERHARFTGYGSGKQCFPRARRSEEKDPFGDFSANSIVFTGVTQKFHDFR